MRRALLLLWVGVVLPFALTLVNGGPDGWLPHVLFHPVYIAFLVVGLVGVRSLRAATDSRPLRRLAAAVGVAAVVAMVGHAGELVAVLRAGGLDAPESVFDEPLHLASAAATVPMVMLAIVLVVVTTGVARIVARGKPVGPTVSRGVRTTHRWASLVFVATVPLLLLLGDVLVVGILAGTALGTLLVTGVQMSGRHYLTRWRRGRNRRDTATVRPAPAAGPSTTSPRRPDPTPAVPAQR